MSAAAFPRPKKEAMLQTAGLQHRFFSFFYLMRTVGGRCKKSDCLFSAEARSGVRNEIVSGVVRID